MTGNETILGKYKLVEGEPLNSEIGLYDRVNVSGLPRGWEGNYQGLYFGGVVTNGSDAKKLVLYSTETGKGTVFVLPFFPTVKVESLEKQVRQLCR